MATNPDDSPRANPHTSGQPTYNRRTHGGDASASAVARIGG